MVQPTGESQPLVVVVDDDQALRDALRFALEIDGYRVETCADAEALLALDLAGEAVCLLIDERLPRMQGLTALAELRLRGVQHPAVLMTTNPNAELRAGAAAVGVPIVEKPLMGDALICAIRAALDRG